MAFFARLASRGVLRIEGRDARKLLQGLVTSDVTLLDAAPQYTCFLSAQGRVLHDAFLVSGPDGSVLLDSELSAQAELTAHLKRYKLRSKVTIRDATDELAVVASWDDGSVGAAAADVRPPSEGGHWADPRLPQLGSRLLWPAREAAPTAVSQIDAAEVIADVYDARLALLGVPNGQAHLPPGEALPLESNLELLNAISFTKGCYLGQELTARTNFRGVVRKRLAPLVLADVAERAECGGGGGDEPAAAAAVSAGLPEWERRLAGWAADGARREGPAAGAKLLGANSKAAATVRSGGGGGVPGVALCRLTALQAAEAMRDDAEGAEDAAGRWRATRPSWWPEHIGAEPSRQ